MAIAALVIAFISLIATIVLGTKNFRKSKRDAFIQRRDHLFQAISQLNAKNSETRLSGARFTTMATAKDSLPSTSKYDEGNKALVADIRTLAKTIQSQAEVWDEKNEKFHSLCAGYTSEKDAENVEELIAIVQLASDNMKRTNEIYLSTLHILETTNPQVAIDLAELRKMEIQLAELEQEKASPT